MVGSYTYPTLSEFTIHLRWQAQRESCKPQQEGRTVLHKSQSTNLTNPLSKNEPYYKHKNVYAYTYIFVEIAWKNRHLLFNND